MAPAMADDDADEARSGARRGTLIPLERILSRIARQHPGQIVDIELDRDDGVWRYEIELVTPRGRVVVITANARTGRFRKNRDDDD